MNWGSVDEAVLAHWRRPGSFRPRHVAVSRGAHQMLSESHHAFSRIDADTDDRVVVAMNVSGEVSIPVLDLPRRAMAEGPPQRSGGRGECRSRETEQGALCAARTPHLPGPGSLTAILHARAS
jgi:hypothetical protein